MNNLKPDLFKGYYVMSLTDTNGTSTFCPLEKRFTGTDGFSCNVKDRPKGGGGGRRLALTSNSSLCYAPKPRYKDVVLPTHVSPLVFGL